jgi:hypothetical protein
MIDGFFIFSGYVIIALIQLALLPVPEGQYINVRRMALS